MRQNEYISFFDQSCRDALPCKKIDDIFTKMGLLKGSKKVILFFLSKPQKRIKKLKDMNSKMNYKGRVQKKIMENSILGGRGGQRGSFSITNF